MTQPSYARVSTSEHRLDAEKGALRAAGCVEIFSDVATQEPRPIEGAWRLFSRRHRWATRSTRSTDDVPQVAKRPQSFATRSPIFASQPKTKLAKAFRFSLRRLESPRTPLRWAGKYQKSFATPVRAPRA